jgi:hypothetical protein
MLSMNQELRSHQEGQRHFVCQCLAMYQRNRDHYLAADHELGMYVKTNVSGSLPTTVCRIDLARSGVI